MFRSIRFRFKIDQLRALAHGFALRMLETGR